MTALDDDELKRRVKNRKPTDLEAAYLVALFEEAERPVEAKQNLVLAVDDGKPSKRKDGKSEKSDAKEIEFKGAKPKVKVNTKTSQSTKKQKRRDDSSSGEDEGENEDREEVEEKESEIKSKKTEEQSGNNSEWRSLRKDMALESYDGTTSLQVFLGKFENCSDHNKWSEEERVRHLVNSLKGTAAQLAPLKVRSGMSSAQLIGKLTVRYGTEDQMATHRAKFHGYKRLKGQSLQELYLEISRLGDLAYPGEVSAVFDAVSVDTFINALSDSALELRLRDKEPKALEEAYRMAERLEAYSKGKAATAAEEPPSRNRFENRTRAVKVPFNRRNDNEGQQNEMSGISNKDFLELKDSVKEMKECLLDLKRGGILSTVTPPEPARPEKKRLICYSCGGEGHFASNCLSKRERQGQQRNERWRQDVESRPWDKAGERRTRPSMATVCFRCDQPGHFARDCTQGNEASRRDDEDDSKMVGDDRYT